MSQQIRDQLQATLGSAYTLERELGGGGMSRVFIAEETALRRKVVVKVLPPELTAGVNVERFNREILLAAKLQHPHIVQVLTAGETNGLPYYTMPFVEGESLRARLARGGALGITEVVGLLRDVARALAYAHERGIVHRDIKPDNVLITGGSATVTDFGIAKAISASRTQGSNETLTQIGTSIGTPTYMSPEQASGDPETDHRADIYSFGCMAYELLAGRPPFVDPAPRKLLAAHMGEKPKPVTDFRPDTPAALAELVMRCLAKEADDRPQRATDLVHVLETVTSSGGSQAMPSVLLGGAGMLRKALAIYAVAFVAVAILAKAAIVGIGLPDWVFPGSLIVMALGLPVILWTGYVHRVARRAMTQTPTYTPGGSPSLTHGTIATMALKAAPKMSWYKTARGGAYAMGGFVALIAAFMIMRQFGIGPFGSLIGAGKLADSNKIVITDFQVTGSDSTLGRVVSDAVRQGLTESSALTVMSPTAVAATLARMQRPQNSKIDFALAREIGIREGAKAIIDGEVSAVSGGYILTLRLVPADSGNPLASISAAGDGPSGLIDAADKATKQLRAKVGESLRRVQGTPALAQVTTGSMEALRKYSEAFRLNAVDRNYGRAVVVAREAVAADSTFAMGWRLMAAALSNAGAPGSMIDSAYQRAYKYQDRMTERERVFMLEGYNRTGPGRDRVKALQHGERLMALGDTFTAANNMALSLATRREFARAESLFALSSRVDSSSALPYGNRVGSLVNLGRFDEAAKVIAEGRRRFPTQIGFAGQAAALLYVRGEMKEYDRVIDSVAASPRPADRNAVEPRLRERALRSGKLAEWRRMIDARAPSTALAAVATGMPMLAGVGFGDSIGVSQVDILVRDSSARAVRRLDATLATGRLRALEPRDRPYFDLTAAYAAAGRPDKAKQILAMFDAEVTDTAFKRFRQPLIRERQADIALAEKKYAEAISLYRRADSLPDGPTTGCTICLYASLANAFDAAGQADSAIAMYEKYLTTPFSTRYVVQYDALLLPRTHWRLGNLYETTGNVPKAAEHYRRFIDLWKDADPELQPRVKAARDRLAKLSPVERPRH